MAFKKKNENPNAVLAVNVVQLALLPDMVEDLMSRKITHHEVVDKVMGLIEEGYTINILKDAERGTYSVRLAAVTLGMQNAGDLLYGNGTTLANAFLSIYGKHFLLANGAPWQSVQTNGSIMS